MAIGHVSPSTPVELISRRGAGTSSSTPGGDFASMLDTEATLSGARQLYSFGALGMFSRPGSYGRVDETPSVGLPNPNQRAGSHDGSAARTQPSKGQSGAVVDLRSAGSVTFAPATTRASGAYIESAPGTGNSPVRALAGNMEPADRSQGGEKDIDALAGRLSEKTRQQTTRRQAFSVSTSDAQDGLGIVIRINDECSETKGRLRNAIARFCAERGLRLVQYIVNGRNEFSLNRRITGDAYGNSAD